MFVFRGCGSGRGDDAVYHVEEVVGARCLGGDSRGGGGVSPVMPGVGFGGAGLALESVLDVGFQIASALEGQGKAIGPAQFDTVGFPFYEEVLRREVVEAEDGG